MEGASKVLGFEGVKQKESVPTPVSDEKVRGRSPSLVGLKVGLSIFILFQLFVVLLAPNGENYIGQKMGPIVEPYIDFFEFTSKWSFFAPEPGPPPVFVDWEVVNRNGDIVEHGRYPDPKKSFFLRDRLNRRIATTEFMMPSEVRVEKIMVPYLCGKFPQADSVKLWRVAYQVPPLEDVAKGKRKIGDDVNLDRRLVSNTFCERKPERNL